jgi:hypothetical protein
MLFGLGWPQWVTIILLVGGLLLTFKMMAKASVRYEAARKAREAREEQELQREKVGNDEDRHPS